MLLPRLPVGEYLASLRLADVLLDTLHFGAGTTTYHALALGVPLVTLAGSTTRAAAELMRPTGGSAFPIASPPTRPTTCDAP